MLLIRKIMALTVAVASGQENIGYLVMCIMINRSALNKGGDKKKIILGNKIDASPQREVIECTDAFAEWNFNFPQRNFG